MVGLTDLSLSCGKVPEHQRQSGALLAESNVKTAGSVCKRRDAVRLGRQKGLQPRANERPAVRCSEKLGGGSVGSITALPAPPQRLSLQGRVVPASVASPFATAPRKAKGTSTCP